MAGSTSCYRGQYVRGQVNPWLYATRRIVYVPATVAEYAGNLCAILDECPPAAWALGGSWYPTYGRYVVARGALRGLTAAQSCALFGILSQQMSITRNVALFDDLLANLDPIDTRASREQIDKMHAILECPQPDRVEYIMHLATGPKINPFSWALYGYTDPVPIDRHAYAAATGIALGEHTMRNVDRRHVTSAYLHAADIYGVSPSVAQATAWIAQRNGDSFIDTLPDRLSQPFSTVEAF